MGGPTTPRDALRLALEDAQGAILGVEERLRCVALRVTQRMRTQAEAEEVSELNAGRCELRQALRHIERAKGVGL